ncbi:type II secretion system minor pseudopilin GspK [Candidatus Thiodubiliella endoseptemdiera]|uniref:Type II secretion system protein K n=1 Tax=Candidatus Thiodubiliella endoseptemdiera TaxID=2738886 RepID=A0A853F531_9GAMM|nr:type II secretion system minor pseudopilin GspK [Candidatus Thiodubiliella endoseptemdiera]
MNNTACQQQGVVLIGVLIVVALISAITALIWQQQHKNFQTVKYTQTQTQALNYLYSMESWAKVILLNDKKTNIDALDEDWASEIPPIPIPGGQIHGKINDLQAKLSINNIVNTKKPNNIVFNNAFSLCLNRLNEQLEQVQMSDLIFAYITELLSDTPTLAFKFKHISELKNIVGMQRQEYYNISPYLNALPKDTPININTAGKEILSCLHPGLSEYSVEALIAERPFSSPEEVLKWLPNILPNNMVNENTFPKSLRATNSKYFLLESSVKINEDTLNAKTIFHRNGAKIDIVNRSYY